MQHVTHIQQGRLASPTGPHNGSRLPSRHFTPNIIQEVSLGFILFGGQRHVHIFPGQSLALACGKGVSMDVELAFLAVVRDV